MTETVLVGLSGGVDSAVAVKLLQNDGYKVKGLFLEMLTDNDFSRAEELARQLKIDLLKKDVKERFQREIVQDFVKRYSTGLTPNPCVLCNPQIKFKYLLETAGELGINNVATGHYVQKIRKEKHFTLKKAKDETKDQSYFLYKLKQEVLQKIKFPLGGLLKEEVREIASKEGLKVPKSESQDVCFLQEGRLEYFLKKNLPDKYFQSGDILDEEGRKVGKHRGLVVYTIGQRKGLDVGGDGPFYVVAKDWRNNILQVSRRQGDLEKEKIYFSKTNWLIDSPRKDKKYRIKIRYQMKEVLTTLKRMDEQRWLAIPERSLRAVTPGQSLVIYNEDELVGGGIISDDNFKVNKKGKK